MIRLALLVGVASCTVSPDFDPTNPARGPGSLVGNGDPVSDGNFVGGNDVVPTARAVAPPSGENTPLCDAACQSYCDGLGLVNPVNQGLCPVTWGAGLETSVIVEEEACRRLYIDLVGQVPSNDTINNDCIGKSWDEVAKSLLNTDEHVLLTQRYYADYFLYDTESASVEAIYDMDDLVRKFQEGRVAYDEFAAVASAHPAVMRRYATPEDIAEAVFTRFLGRPPFPYERADFSRLYTVWEAGYINHKPLDMRVPDAFLGYQCVDEYGDIDPELEGLCTSTQFGFNQVILTPDFRSGGIYGSRQMWSGLVSPQEWYTLQTPGRVLSEQQAFWEKAVQDVLIRYLGYDLGEVAPQVRQNLVNYLLQYNGDIRAVHYAVVTSFAYLQSSNGTTASQHKWITGPRKQLQAEDWIKAAGRISNTPTPLCDHRISRPEEFLDADNDVARQLLESSRWELDGEGNLQDEYANLARTLGGCPRNGVSTRFRIVSLLTTSAQLNFAKDICDPGLEDNSEIRASVEQLLPDGLTATTVIDTSSGNQIASHLTQELLSRQPTAEENTAFDTAATQCAGSTCSAEEFSRAMCFVILSSAENLFY